MEVIDMGKWSVVFSKVCDFDEHENINCAPVIGGDLSN